jgi:hypothetical protein
MVFVVGSLDREQASAYKLVEAAPKDVVDCCGRGRRHELLYVDTIKESRVLRTLRSACTNGII